MENAKETTDKQIFNGTNGTNSTVGSDELQIYPGEISYLELILLFLFLALWMMSIIIFFTRWNNISIMEPVGTRSSYKPKNLETITVVKTEDDSVLYCK